MKGARFFLIWVDIIIISSSSNGSIEVAPIRFNPIVLGTVHLFNKKMASVLKRLQSKYETKDKRQQVGTGRCGMEVRSMFAVMSTGHHRWLPTLDTHLQ